MLDCPANLLYHPRHLWVRPNDSQETVKVGITDELQERLPEIYSVDLPAVGTDVEIDAPCFHFHLPSGIRHLKAPLSGRVVEINSRVLDNPELLHLAPYEHWLVRMEIDIPEELHLLLDAERYKSFLESL